MTLVRDAVHFFRLANWERKISCLRPLGYTFLGYAVADAGNAIAMSYNAAAIAGILACSHALNDYYDYSIGEDDSFLASLVKRRVMSLRRAFLLSWLPLVLCAGIIWSGTAPAALALLFLALVIAYSCPPLRLKDRRPWGFLTPPSCAAMLFLQAFLVFSHITPTALVLAALLFIFHLYVESIHQMADAASRGADAIEEGRWKGLMYLFQAMSIAAALAASIVQPWFLVTVLFSLVRLLALLRTDVAGTIFVIRKGLWSPLWSLYEFAVYAVIGWCGVFAAN